MTRPKIFNRALTGIMALAMVFGISAGAFAAMPNDGGYVIGNVNDYQYDGQIDVTVVVESRPYSTTDSSKIFEDFDVTLGDVNGTDQISYVSDVLYDISSDANNNYTFYSSGTTPMTATSSFVSGVNDGSKTYSSVFYFDGWMVRVNGQFPLIDWTSGPPTGYPQGEAISGIPVSDGDVISFYYDNPYPLYDASFRPTISAPVDFVYPEASYDAGTGKVTVNLTKNSNVFDGSTYAWTIDAFSALALDNKAVNIYNAAGASVGSANTNASGIASINTGTLAAGTYTVVAATAANQNVTALEFDNFTMVSGVLLSRTTGYSQFTVN
ncbi:MAG TPA: hypothetical protein PKD52_06835 [Clostridiales bacterium]|nr:hypothetical protein [Clostridiales bacterium]